MIFGDFGWLVKECRDVAPDPNQFEFGLPQAVGY
jgi:hypothetical protein